MLAWYPRSKIMPLITRSMTLAAVLAASALSAQAQDGDVAAGHAFARESCNACHVVEAEQRVHLDGSSSDRLFGISPIPAVSRRLPSARSLRRRTRRCRT